MDAALSEAFARDPLAAESGAPAAAPVRVAWAAAHVVMRASYGAVPHSPARPGAPEELAEHIDWERTLALRARLDGLGLGVAEAMDTAQRARLGWRNARRLIRGTGALALRLPFVAGAGTDSLPPGATEPRESALVDAVVAQAREIQDAGGIPILLPIASLARRRASADEYVRVYAAILAELDGPLLAHWLGEMFAPELAGYFPGDSFARVMALDPEKLRGAKLSLLDADLERRVRAELATREQVVLTGDDLHFVDLIEGDDPAVRGAVGLGNLRLPVGAFSHALLGVLDAVARPASAALDALARGDRARYRALFEPCEAFGHVAFEAPVPLYKATLAFVAWLDGLQPNAMVVDHLERERPRAHFLRAAELAARAGAFADLAGARARMAAWLEDPAVAA